MKQYYYRCAKTLIASIICGSVLLSCGGSSGESANGGDKNISPDIVPTENPIVIGYFTNYGIYGAEYLPAKIPHSVSEVLYAFEQIGNCGSVTRDGTQADIAKHASEINEDGFANELHPEFCFAVPGKKQNGDQDFKLHSTDYWGDFDIKFENGVGAIQAVLNQGKPTLLSFGGWSLSAAIRPAITNEHRTDFIKSIIAFMVHAQQDATQKFAGVDIDWEPNSNKWTLGGTDKSIYKRVTKQDLINYKNFLFELKDALTKAKQDDLLSNDLLRIAITANPVALEDVDTTYGGKYWQEISNKIDSIDPMTYDYHGSFDGNGTANAYYTAFNSALYNDERAAAIPSHPYPSNFGIQGTVETLINNCGVNPKKIIAGAPAYGKPYVIDKNNINFTNPYVPFADGYQTRPGFYAITNRSIYTNKFITDTDNNAPLNLIFTPIFDEQSGVNYAYSVAGNTGPIGAIPTLKAGQSVFINFDTCETAKKKMEWAQKKGLAGMMVWSLDTDTRPDELGYPAGSIVAGFTKQSCK